MKTIVKGILVFAILALCGLVLNAKSVSATGDCYVWEGTLYLLDSDCDGLSNNWETYSSYGTSPYLADTDLDGLTDKEEIFVYFTLPLDSDTDNGGVMDGAEIDGSTDPWVPSDDELN